MNATPSAPAPAAEAPETTRRERLFVLLAVLCALALRVLPFAGRVFVNGGILPTGDPDVYYHLRRIELAARYWPQVPDFDPWINFPAGGYSPWPPLFDFMPATLASVTGLPPAWVAVAWPPLLGALSVVPCFALLRPVLGRAAALLASVLFAVLPAHIAISLLGRVDHHVAEIGLQLWIYAWFARDLRRLEAGAPPSAASSIGFGLLIGACFLTWAASMIFLWVVPCVACLWLLAPRDGERARVLARHLLIAFGTAALCCTPFALHNVARGRAAFAYYHLSLLTLALCLAHGALVAAAAWIVAPLREQRLRSALARAGCVVLAAASPLLLPELRAGLLGGLGFIARKNEFVTSISESAPLLSTALTRGFAFQHVGHAYWLLPPLSVWLALRCSGRSLRSGGWLVLATFSVNATVLAFMQARFLHYAAAVVAALPWLAAQSVPGLGPRWRQVVSGACICAIAPALLYYWSPVFRPGGEVPIQQIDRSGLAFFLAIAAVTPADGDPSDLARKPSYGIFAPWELGHPLLAISGRAVVANNYGDQLEGGSFEDQGRLYARMREDRVVLELLARRRCRYLITTARTTRSAPDTFAARLHAFDGADSARGPGSGQLRLVTLAPSRDDAGLFSHKLFQVVRGATLRVMGPLEKPSLRAVSAQSLPGYGFSYARDLLPGAHGGLQVQLAYPGAYELLLRGGELRRFAVSEQAVRTGETIELTL